MRTPMAALGADITFYVPTSGRLSFPSPTLDSLAAAGVPHVVVCPAAEVAGWAARLPSGASVQAEPVGTSNIGECRAFIYRTCPTPYVFMLDDDLSFSYRGGTLPGRPSPEDLRSFLLGDVRRAFSTWACVVMGGRVYSHLRPEVKTCGLASWAFGFDVARTRAALAPALGRLPVFEDMDWTLTLLRAGIENVILSRLTCQARNADFSGGGGCSTYRDPALVERCAARLHELHRPFLTRHAPHGKSSKNPQSIFRTSWRRAFLSSGAQPK